MFLLCFYFVMFVLLVILVIIFYSKLFFKILVFDIYCWFYFSGTCVLKRPDSLTTANVYSYLCVRVNLNIKFNMSSTFSFCFLFVFLKQLPLYKLNFSVL